MMDGKTTKTMMGRIIKGLVPAACLLAMSSPAEAQEIQLTGPLAGAPAVRQMRLHRKKRFEVAPALSFTLLDEYQRTMLAGARVNYNFTDWFALGVWGGYGVIQSTTGLTDQIQEKTSQRFDPNSPDYNTAIADTSRRLTALNVGKDFKAQLGTMQWVAAPQISVVPFRGKLAVFDKVFFDTDVYFFAGPAFVGLRERADCGPGTTVDCSARNLDGPGNTPGTVTTKDTATRVAVTATFGLGLNFYTGRWSSIGVEWRALPYSWNTGGFDIRGGGEGEKFPDSKVDAADRQFKFNQMMTISFGVFLPSELKSSE